VQDHILFIDTETSGLPKDWTLPYSNNTNWPYAVQVSWIVYSRNGVELKREDHFIRDNDFEIGREAYKVHGISREFLNDKGERRQYVMELLLADLQQYQPMLVGHYMELDYNITGVDFYRLGITENPMANLPMYCTMLGSRQYIRTAQVDYLRLGQLYGTLFNRPLDNQHNALVDALATAECFFEMLRTGAVTEDSIEKQRLDRLKRRQLVAKSGCGLPILLLLILTLLIAYWL
jgi:DNA polymerase-3 subunit epsilon